jgi:hypothetical protein
LKGSHETNSITTQEVVGRDTSSSAHSVNENVEDLVVPSQIPSSSAAAAVTWTSAITCTNPAKKLEGLTDRLVGYVPTEEEMQGIKKGDFFQR